MGKKIVVDLDEKGNLNAETFGFTGDICFAEFDRLFKDIVEERPYDPKKEDETVVYANESLSQTSNSNTTQYQNVKDIKREH